MSYTLFVIVQYKYQYNIVEEIEVIDLVASKHNKKKKKKGKESSTSKGIFY